MLWLPAGCSATCCGSLGTPRTPTRRLTPIPQSGDPRATLAIRRFRLAGHLTRRRRWSSDSAGHPAGIAGRTPVELSRQTTGRTPRPAVRRAISMNGPSRIVSSSAVRLNARAARVRSLALGRVIEAPVEGVLGARKDWARLTRSVADRDDGVELQAEKLLDRLAGGGRPVDCCGPASTWIADGAGHPRKPR
jgi:hypothetical protein